MKRAAFYTLGCKVNQYETEAISGIFEQNGYEIVDFETAADVYVINTCTVTNLSDRKSRQMIRRAKHHNEASVVVVVGCYAQTAPEEVERIPGVNLILGTKDRSRIMEHIDSLGPQTRPVTFVDDIMKTREFEGLNLTTYKGRTRAFLKIQEGCSQFCSYCIIPYARGPIRSRRPEEVVNEVKSLADRGFKEIVLTGIHVASYGKDLGNTTLLDIMKRINGVQGIERLRLGSLEPTVINEEFVQTALGLEKLCPHFHISLQSGCDATLKRMNRKYTRSEYREIVDRLRRNIPDAAITTDVMVGFPGETQEEFEAAYQFLSEINLMQLHIFKYSPRKGTPAATFKDQVTPEIKEERSKRLIELSGRCTFEYNQRYAGKVVKVLYEQEAAGRDGWMEGLTPNYIRVLSPGNRGAKGEIMDTKLLEVKPDHMEGKII